jgi:hypothetical protein
MVTDRYGVVYKVSNTANGMLYIGMTRGSVTSRFSCHKTHAKYPHRYPQSPLTRAMHAIGIRRFRVEVIEVCLTRPELEAAEARWIATLRTMHPDGYNVTADARDTSHLDKFNRLTLPGRTRMAIALAMVRFNESVPRSGLPLGVTRLSTGRYSARIIRNGKRIWVGTFRSAAEAASARAERLARMGESFRSMSESRGQTPLEFPEPESMP